MLNGDIVTFGFNKMFWKEKSCRVRGCAERNELFLKVTHGSPKLKDALRKRLKEHVKLRRDSCINKLRHLVEDSGKEGSGRHAGDETACDAVPACPGDEGAMGGADPLTDEECELRLMEEILEEALTREEAWFLEQCEEFLREDDAFLDSLLEAVSSEGVLCPLCSRATLVAWEGQGLVHCPACRVSWRWPGSLDELGRSLSSLVDAHSVTCSQQVGFTIVPEGDTHSLVIVCTACGLFSVV